MSSITWTPRAVSAEARDWSGAAWRLVEAQHIAATMKLVDTRSEQDMLEALLESAKPTGPAEAARLHYLLATPFRYPARPGGTRFRGEADAGVFYGAGSVRTAAAELGYWRWKFLRDAVNLERLHPVAHTAFRADIAIATVDLRQRPFTRDAARWQHPQDYGATQAFARIAREAGVGAIRYRSVRDPQPGWCIALLTPRGFAGNRPRGGMQTWFLAVSRQAVSWRREGEAWEFSWD
ncbi:MAG: RES family NAD+ phosphorylase [Chromatiales bacterium]|nr:RES family NAD+ phosphorylase [Chromatiales bacterium]